MNSSSMNEVIKQFDDRFCPLTEKLMDPTSWAHGLLLNNNIYMPISHHAFIYDMPIIKYK
jgi:hypothetical protein